MNRRPPAESSVKSEMYDRVSPYVFGLHLKPISASGPILFFFAVSRRPGILVHQFAFKYFFKSMLKVSLDIIDMFDAG